MSFDYHHAKHVHCNFGGVSRSGIILRPATMNTFLTHMLTFNCSPWSWHRFFQQRQYMIPSSSFKCRDYYWRTYPSVAVSNVWRGLLHYVLQTKYTAYYVYSSAANHISMVPASIKTPIYAWITIAEAKCKTFPRINIIDHHLRCDAFLQTACYNHISRLWWEIEYTTNYPPRQRQVLGQGQQPSVCLYRQALHLLHYLCRALCSSISRETLRRWSINKRSTLVNYYYYYGQVIRNGIKIVVKLFRAIDVIHRFNSKARELPKSVREPPKGREGSRGGAGNCDRFRVLRVFLPRNNLLRILPRSDRTS